MNIRLFFGYVLFTLLTAIPFGTFAFSPTVSVLYSRTFTTHAYSVPSGEFDVSNRNVNLGFEVTNQFPLSKSYFIKTGIRYGQLRNIITGKNQINEYLDYPNPLLWERRYEAFSVPLHVGKEIKVKGRNKGNAFLGVSLGILSTSYSKTLISTGIANNSNFNDEISITVVDKTNQTPHYFLPTADIGANYIPFESAPRLSTGILFSLQLQQTQPATYTGVVQNVTKKAVYNYEITHQHQFMNCSFVLSYKFGKK
jgi:hypothetical protein